ncbi:type II secretion system protein [Sulfurimonas sp. HSL-1716]|uniref:type II secretion system protein n=1 Tax=Hydrocurvibacter sulfurireducens TaxID=3131937 RepID=UPI0031F8C9A8
MNKKRSAFTMIEMVFVIVVLAILAGIAIPKFTATRTDAIIAKGRSDVASIRTAISTERQKRFMKGDSSYISVLDHQAAAPGEGVVLFDNNGTAGSTLLTYGITTKNADGGWMKTAANTYTFQVAGTTNTFTYNSASGTFSCTAGTYCDNLTK